jgi:acetylornithine deacetylase/succinyl-diaminopimelate desuccinylase-like protein
MNRLSIGFFMGLTVLSWESFASADTLRQEVDGYRSAHEAMIVGELEGLVRLPSVAAQPGGMAAAASKIQSLLVERGFAVQAWPTVPGRPPVIFASYPVAGARRTVLFYAHYDGQPVTPSQWSSDPFRPAMRSGAQDVDWKNAKQSFDPEWRLYGRAAADDKVTIIAFLSAFDALKVVGRKPSVNIKLLWEGEEEAGSAHLPEVLRDHARELGSDVLLIGDGPEHQSRTPTLYFGARGSMVLEATVYGPLRALHDGHYGNWVPNPAMLAASLITQLRDVDGRILIPGFMDDVRPLTASERAAITALPPVEEELRREFGIGGTEGTEGLTASTMRPALNIRGLRSGQVGAEANAAIPPDAIVSLDFRLVPDQVPERVRGRVEEFLRAKGWTLVTAAPDLATRLAHPRIVRLAWGDGYPGLRSNMDSAPAQAVIRAAGQAAGRPVTVLPMMGASVPIYMFYNQFHVPIIGLPIANHDDNQHAANENIRLRNLWDGIVTYAAMMGALDW